MERLKVTRQGYLFLVNKGQGKKKKETMNGNVSEFVELMLEI